MEPLLLVDFLLRLRVFFISGWNCTQYYAVSLSHAMTEFLPGRNPRRLVHSVRQNGTQILVCSGKIGGKSRRDDCIVFR